MRGRVMQVRVNDGIVFLLLFSFSTSFFVTVVVWLLFVDSSSMYRSSRNKLKNRDFFAGTDSPKFREQPGRFVFALVDFSSLLDSLISSEVIPDNVGVVEPPAEFLPAETPMCISKFSADRTRSAFKYSAKKFLTLHAPETSSLYTDYDDSSVDSPELLTVQYKRH